ncbi:glycosyltransferase family 34 protein [Bipolaris maydis ATCC 48331]|nr:glycosyltransferase family 34 protein [Bipolaris maydis ATCC 48331]ENI01152.1 glycosyltransferase family 34 protein [Bipolaris maydis ATCC 48331]KAH7563739.1 glycosyltransferase family 34 protein [Bipolaris maydis]
MLVRSARRLPPSLVLLLAFLAFLGWELNQGMRHEERPLPSSPPPPPPPAPVEPEQKPHGEEKKPPRLALVTFVTEQRSYLYLSLRNKDHYSRRHGYDLVIDYEQHSETGNPVYWKFDMIERLVKSAKYDWIWWLDFDTLITNTNVNVANIIDDELQNVEHADNVDYIFTNDCNGLNLGSFLVRAHDRSLEFIRRALDLRHTDEGKDYSEQDALVRVMKEEPYSKRFIVAPQSKLNAFPDEIKCYEDEHGQWEPGKFILHFAGAWAHVEGDDPTGQLMDKYKHEIMWGKWEDIY